MDTTRFGRGFRWGAVATVVMSGVMVLGVATGLSPMPRPIPAALVGTLTEGALPRPALMATAAILHLAYGGLWGGVLAVFSRRVSVGQALGLAVFLWLVMQVVVLPFLGWGLFGTALTPAIAVATLVLHLVYGASLGWLMDRDAGPAAGAG